MDNSNGDNVSSQEVHIGEADVSKALSVPIRAHVRIRGIEKIHPRVISRDIEAIKRSENIEEVTSNIQEAKLRWLRMGIFGKVDFNLEPTFCGEANDVCVHIDVVESKPKKTIGVFTTDTVLPELTLSLENVLGGRYSFSGSYIPPTSRAHALSFSMLSNAAYLGQSSEYYMGRRTENKAYHLASRERIDEVKATARNEKRGILSEFAVGFQRRVMVPREGTHLFDEILPDFRTTFKGYIRHELGISSVWHHADPYLCSIYPLPIKGFQLSMRNELAGGPLGGLFNFLKSELQTAKYWPLGAFCSIQWNSKVAGIWSYNQGRIPLNDRLFLSSCHVRGFRSIGPSTVDMGVRKGGHFAATGGNALWAASVSLNFPFLLFPNNGLAAMHLFANAGNLRMVNSSAELFDIYRWFRTCAASLGCGVVVTRVPLFGVTPNGRFELNLCMPIGIDERGNIVLRNGNKHLFDRVKFGLTWSSALSL